MKNKINQKAPWYRSPDFDPAHEPTYTPKSCRGCKHALTGTYSTSTKIVCDHPDCERRLDIRHHVKKNTLPWWCPCFPGSSKPKETYLNAYSTCDTCAHLTIVNGCNHPQALNTGPQPGPRYIHPIGNPPGKRFPRPSWCPLQVTLQGEPLTPEVLRKVAEQVKNWNQTPKNQPEKPTYYWHCSVCNKKYAHAHWDPVKTEARCPNCGSRLYLKENP